MSRSSSLFSYNVIQYTSVKSVGVIYTLVLTGSQDSTTDLDLPMNSYQATIKNGFLSTHDFQVTLTEGLADKINARVNGDLEIYREVNLADGSTTKTLFMTANFNSASRNIGSSSASIIIRGSKTVTNLAPRTIDVEQVKGWGVNSYNERVFSIESYSTITAGDIATVDGEDITIRQVRLNLKPNTFDMELTEQL